MPKPKAVTTDEEADLAKIREEANEAAAKEASEEKGEETTPVSESAPEETTPSKEKETEEKEVKPTEGGKTEDSEDLSEEELARLSSKAQKRYRQLAAERKQAREELAEERKKRKSLEEQQVSQRIVEDKGKREVSTEGLPWDVPAEPEERVLTQEQYEQELTNKAAQVVRVELQKEKRRQNYANDLKAVESEYKSLNPDSETYDRNLDDQISKWFGGLLKVDPDIRLKTFVDNLMSLRVKGTEEGKLLATKELAKQAGKQALAPTGERSPTSSEEIEKAIDQTKTIDELERLRSKIS